VRWGVSRPPIFRSLWMRLLESTGVCRCLRACAKRYPASCPLPTTWRLPRVGSAPSDVLDGPLRS
jgi:hypothetical protein